MHRPAQLASGLQHCAHVPCGSVSESCSNGAVSSQGRVSRRGGEPIPDWNLQPLWPPQPNDAHCLPSSSTHRGLRRCLGRPCSALGSSSPPMPVIPIPRRVRSFHGPHTTCMHSACGATHTSKLVRTKYNNFDLYLRSRCMYSFLRFLLYFGCSLLTSLLWVTLSALFFLQYVSVRVLLRLQYKLSVILLLLGHRRLDFGVVNDLIIYSMQITMFLVGGLGWCFMVFVDM